MYKLIFKLVISVVILVVLYIGLATMFPGLNFLKPKPLELKKTAVIIEESKNIAQLFSAVYYAEVVIDTTKLIVETKTDLTASLTSFGSVEYKDSTVTEIAIIGHGNCYAGNDLKKLQPEDIVFNDSVCTIKVPTAEIFNTVINPSEFDIFIDDGNWSPEDVQIFKQMAVKKIEDSALKSGIIEKANKRTKKLLHDFIQSLGFKKVNVEFI